MSKVRIFDVIRQFPCDEEMCRVTTYGELRNTVRRLLPLGAAEPDIKIFIVGEVSYIEDTVDHGQPCQFRPAELFRFLRN